MGVELHIDVSQEAGKWTGAHEEVALTAAKLAWMADGGADLGRPGELSLVLADDAMVRELNRDWRDKDKPTNVLSFPAEDEIDIPEAPRMLGDVVLAFETLCREAEEQSKPLEHHLSHLVIHGVLHLLGYDHIEDTEAQEMEALEAQLLESLGISNPYLTPMVMEH